MENLDFQKLAEYVRLFMLARETDKGGRKSNYGLRKTTSDTMTKFLMTIYPHREEDGKAQLHHMEIAIETGLHRVTICRYEKMAIDCGFIRVDRSLGSHMKNIYTFSQDLLRAIKECIHTPWKVKEVEKRSDIKLPKIEMYDLAKSEKMLFDMLPESRYATEAPNGYLLLQRRLDSGLGQGPARTMISILLAAKQFNSFRFEAFYAQVLDPDAEPRSAYDHYRKICTLGLMKTVSNRAPRGIQYEIFADKILAYTEFLAKHRSIPKLERLSSRPFANYVNKLWIEQLEELD